jgi:mannitol/fructose-specific phosphotransferase system IIA component (Ntr-type)
MFVNLSSLIGKNLVAVNLKSRAKEAVISEIVEYICSQKKIKNKNEILQTVLEREKKETTGIGDGVAIPHARLEHLKEVLFFCGNLQSWN